MENLSIYSSPKDASSPVDPIVPLVKQQLQVILASEGSLQEVLDYLRESNGKMVRPILVSHSHRICGEADETTIIQLATGVELIHMASLVHDDIIDQSNLRRGQPTIQARYGPAVAVLAGDFLFAAAFSLFTRWNQAGVLSLMTDVIRNMCAGEVDQLVAPKQDEGFYWNYIHKKTACLLGAACKVGAMVSSLPTVENMDKMEQFGLNLGYAFQLVDDILDFTGDSKILGKMQGSDFQQGIWTLPIIRGVNRMVIPSDWRVSLSQPELNQLLTDSGVLDEVYQEACTYSLQAIELLSDYQDGLIKDKLTQIARFVVDRNH